MGIFGFILIILLAIFFIILSFVGNILRLIFGLGRSSGTDRKQPGKETDTVNAKENLRASSKKVFAKDEGEYIEFEEIKEDDPK